jgi:hypothetical protein
VKKIIFSQYSSKVNLHPSVNQFKRDQFAKYKDLLIAKQKQYAKMCDADYECFELDEGNYDDIQFSKLLRFEELSKHYDEIVYLDLDVVPITKVSMFDKFDMNWVCAYSIKSPLDINVIYWNNKANTWHAMDMYSKTCVKNAMLCLDGISGSDYCINTGVLGMNKAVIDKLEFSNKLQKCKELFYQAKDDNLYPPEMSKSWQLNNEVIFTYIIESDNIPFLNINMPWNFILDHITSDYSAAAHLIHVVNKKFNNYNLFHSL